MLWKPYSQRLFFQAFDKRNSLELCGILEKWRSLFWGPCVGRWTRSVCIWGSEGVCSIKWIFPSICKVAAWSLEIISDFPPAIASPTFIGLQARRELQWALHGVPTLAFGVEHGAFLTPDALSQWTTYAETWHLLLWVVESYHLLKWQSPMATTAVIAAAVGIMDKPKSATSQIRAQPPEKW